MAASAFCTVLSVPAPLAHSGGGTSSLRVTVVSPIHVVWADASTDDYGPGAVLSAYDNAKSVDGGAFVWVVIISHGTSGLWLAKEFDTATFGSLGALSGQFAACWRIDGDALYKIPLI